MPVFTFSCSACSHHFEMFSLPGEQPDIRCSNCGSTEARRMVPLVSIRPTDRRRRGLVDMSSNSCPCGCGKRAAG